jgi:hypothetical protein
MERRRRGPLEAAGALLFLGLVAANGQCERPQPLESVYALTADSALREGCFAPLQCPVALADDLGGTFRLALVAPGGATDLYAVRDVFWLVRLYGEDIPITGSGSYLDGPVQDRLQLELKIGDEEVQHFDSGFVPGEGLLGSSDIDLTISINHQQYFDTVIDVRAVAFPPLGEKTPCGPLGLACDAETEICVARTPIGPATVHSCEPIPAGCEQDRSCGCADAVVCGAPYDVCTEAGRNQLQCECPQCQ